MEVRRVSYFDASKGIKNISYMKPQLSVHFLNFSMASNSAGYYFKKGIETFILHTSSV
jgi:hypothetical protein